MAAAHQGHRVKKALPSISILAMNSGHANYLASDDVINQKKFNVGNAAITLHQNLNYQAFGIV